MARALKRVTERLRVGEDSIEVEAADPQEVMTLRRFVGQINGTSYAQPYLVEDPPGHFVLYVGEAAERVRTARGIQ